VRADVGGLGPGGIGYCCHPRNWGVGKTAVTRYTGLRCPRSGTTPAGWLRILGGSRDVVDRARPALIRIRLGLRWVVATVLAREPDVSWRGCWMKMS